MTQVNQVKLGAKFIADTPHRESHDRCLWAARMRRDSVAQRIPEWEEMRELASQIKKHTLSHLEEYLIVFEERLKENGVHVHWALDAEEHNRIVLDIFQSHGVKVVTKGKSRIQQLDDQQPSHIVMPAIHKLRGDVARLFAEKLGSDPDIDDPPYLNSVMRKDMRQHYIKADAGMCGVNFGNADISANIPPLFVASMGIEKLIPTQSDLALFIRLLSRSALGLDITQYTSHYHGPRKGQEMHLIIVDNGRTSRLGSDYWEVLKCIRCGACMNTCPVFRRTSGLSYDAPYMGPIGIVLEPSYDLDRYARLPYSCTHCGSCGNVCPVKVPIPDLVFYWRDVVVKAGKDQLSHRIQESGMELVLRNATNLSHAEKLGLWALRNLPESLLTSRLNPWAKAHANPVPPKETFREYYARKYKKN